MSKNSDAKDSIVIERTFEAPIEIIWQMWTRPEHFKNWYGPQGVTVPVAQMDVRVGGKRLICMEMQRPDRSMKMWFSGEYREVHPHTRLVYTDSMADEQGNVLPPSAMGMPDDYPVTTEVIVVLEDLGGRTKMVLTHVGVAPESGASSGWEQAFAKMADRIKIVLAGQ